MVSSSYPAGTEVEVRSNEEGFKGAWFEATVVRSLTKYHRYTVRYAALVSDEISGEPLEDTVYCTLVRPRPPPRSDPAARFELHQLVEALHNDGWWKGVVSEVPKGKDGLYRVCFPSSREELEFKGEDLREQLEWAKGKWVAVQHKKVEEEDLTFVVGSRVEVSRDKENYGAAWYVGTVLKVIGKINFLVEYEYLRADNDGVSGELLKEIVDLQYIRPSSIPVSQADSTFHVLEDVEAFHEGGWVAGVVSEVRPGSSYIVKTKHQEKEIEVDQTAIRPCFDWTNGRWVRISQDKSGTKSRRRGRKSLVAKRSGSLISTPSFSIDNGEIARISDVSNLKAKTSEEARVDDMHGEIAGTSDVSNLKAKTSDQDRVDDMDGEQTKVDGMDGEIAGTSDVSNSKTKTSDQDRADDMDGEQTKVDGTDGEIAGTSDVSNSKAKTSEQDIVDDMDGVTARTSHVSNLNSRASEQDTVDDINGEIPRTPDVAHLKARKSEKARGDDTVEIFPPSKRLKKGRSLEDHLKLVDAARSVGRTCKQRSRVAKRSSLSITALFSRNNNGEVGDRFGASSLTDKKVKGANSAERASSSQLYNKPNKGKVLEDHLPLVGGNSKNSRVVTDISSAAPLPVGSPALPNRERFPKKSASRKRGKKSLSLSFSLSTGLYQEEGVSKVHGTQAVNSVEGSCCLGVASAHQSKTANFGLPSVQDESTSSFAVADVEDRKAGHDLIGSTKRRRKKLAVRSRRRKRKLRDVVDVAQNAQADLMERKRGRPPKKVTCMNGRNDVIVGDNDGREIVAVNQAPAVAVLDNGKSLSDNVKSLLDNVKSLSLDNTLENNSSMLTVNIERKVPANDIFSICLCNMQADIMEDSPETPEIVHSSPVAKSLKYSAIQHLPVLKSFNCRAAETEAEVQKQASPSVEDNIPKYDDPIETRIENGVDLESSPIDPLSNGLALLKGYDMCGHDEFTTSESPSEKGFVEIEDTTNPNDSPSGSSLSREDCVPYHDGSTRGGSPSERTIFEVEGAPRNPAPSGCSPSEEINHDHEKIIPSVLPSEKAIVKAEGRGGSASNPSRLLCNNVALPFIKESSMWEIVESMEAFREMPQQPHFHPLEQYEVEFREGMAIGLMVTFANLVDSIQKLQITDSQDVFEEKLKALVPLELNGFNVHFVRSRLERLLEIRGHANQSEGKKASLNEKIMQGEDERDQLDALVTAHNKIIMELEENLCRYRERRTSVLSGRDRKDSEIVQLKMDLQATEEAYFSAEERFNIAIDAPWGM